MTEKQSVLLLWFIVNASPSAFWKLMQAYKTAHLTLQKTSVDWQNHKIHATHIARFQEYKQNGKPQSYIDCLNSVRNKDYEIIFSDDIDYPKQLDILIDKPPLLFIKGNPQVLNQAQIAIVGTRKPTQTAHTIATDFAKQLASEGLWVTSGLATGIDTCAHVGALQHGEGRTVVVLGNGIDTCYPKQNQNLFAQIIREGGVICSELLPHTQPLAHNFPRRNRIVSALSLATLVVEAALKSGSLITAGFAAEQGKLVFAIPGHIYNSQAKGCHHLIREGAILVDSVEQIIEDINLPRRIHQSAQMDDQIIPTTNSIDKQPHKPSPDVSLQNQADTIKPANTINTADSIEDTTVNQALEEPLKLLLKSLDWSGIDIDTLIETTGLDIGTLTSQLMELELHGLIVHNAGLYMRCRQA